MTPLAACVVVTILVIILYSLAPSTAVPINGRPTTRQASVWARGVAKNSKTRLLEKRSLRAGLQLLVVGLTMPPLPQAPRQLIIICGCIFLALVRLIRTRRAYVRPPLSGAWRQMTPQSFLDAEIREFFGFDSVALLQRALNAWAVPATLVIGQDPNPAKNYNANGVVCMLVMLHRLKNGDKLTAMEARFGADYSTMSRLAEAGSRWLVITHGHRLVDSTIFAPHFPLYNAAIRTINQRRFGHLAHRECLNALPPSTPFCPPSTPFYPRLPTLLPHTSNPYHSFKFQSTLHRPSSHAPPSSTTAPTSPSAVRLVAGCSRRSASTGMRGITCLVLAPPLRPVVSSCTFSSVSSLAATLTSTSST